MERYRSVILSDVHLGAYGCKIDEVNHFLKNVRCDRLILNGDIIDGWYLKRSGGWSTKHMRFVRLVLKKIEKQKTEVVYVRGNHDDFLARVLPVAFGGLTVVEEFVHDTPQGPYLVLHGDVFDAVTTNFPILSHLGDIGYNLLLRLNRLYNTYRAWRGKEYFSLSAAIKARVKRAVSFVSSFEHHIGGLARKRGCVGVICGHIHTPADKTIENVHYLNSGDWVESLTAIVERYGPEGKGGVFELVTFSEFCARVPLPPPKDRGGDQGPDLFDELDDLEEAPEAAGLGVVPTGPLNAADLGPAIDPDPLRGAGRAGVVPARDGQRQPVGA